MDKLTGRVRAAVEKYQLIEEGDRIAVGVSGGKDSLFLLCALAELSQYYPKHFSVVAVTADPCFGGVPGDYSQIQGLCDALGVPYIIRKTYLGPLIFEERKEENPCSLCARMRRGILHNICVEEGISKLALPIVKSACPADGVTARKDTADLVKQLEKQFPHLRTKVLGAMQRANLDGWGDTTS